MQSQVVQEPPSVSARIAASQFLFVVCQHGAEDTLKRAWMGSETGLSLAFSRPGLLTFKFRSADRRIPEHILARLSGWSLGQVRSINGGQTLVAEEMIGQVLQIAGLDWDAIHVFERDRGLPGVGGFEPGASPLAESIENLLRTTLNSPESLQKIHPAQANTTLRPAVNQTCPVGSRVLDLLLVEPDSWLIGCHLAEKRHECWPGGVFPQAMDQAVISRAYYKIAEALAWSGLPIRAGDRIVELGSAPGGACQRLLDLGLEVTGVDAAEMAPHLLQHPRFEHWRSKTAGLKRKLFSKFKWLAADANVAPNYTLDMVDDIVNYPGNRIQGMLMTFKLSSYDMVEQLPPLLERVRSWGYSRVEARQLATNRQECIVVAERRK